MYYKRYSKKNSKKNSKKYSKKYSRKSSKKKSRKKSKSKRLNTNYRKKFIGGLSGEKCKCTCDDETKICNCDCNKIVRPTLPLSLPQSWNQDPRDVFHSLSSTPRQSDNLGTGLNEYTVEPRITPYKSLETNGKNLGFYNIGNTCYLNAILQLFIRLDTLYDIILNLNYDTIEIVPITPKDYLNEICSREQPRGIFLLKVFNKIFNIHNKVDINDEYTRTNINLNNIIIKNSIFTHLPLEGTKDFMNAMEIFNFVFKKPLSSTEQEDTSDILNNIFINLFCFYNLQKAFDEFKLEYKRFNRDKSTKEYRTDSDPYIPYMYYIVQSDKIFTKSKEYSFSLEKNINFGDDIDNWEDRPLSNEDITAGLTITEETKEVYKIPKTNLNFIIYINRINFEPIFPPNQS